jgi:cytosine/uracil/thiamine/allantoin permease
MVSILVWISPWAAIMLVDYFVIRRGALDVAELYCRSALPSTRSTTQAD